MPKIRRRVGAKKKPMKLSLFIIGILMLVTMAPAVSAQDSLAQKVDSLSSKMDKLNDVLSQIKKTLALDNDEKETACIISLFDHISGRVKYYDNDEVEKGEVEIETVIFDIKDGLILDMQVVCKQGKIFSNYHAPIPLTRYDRCNWLSYHDGKDYVYIKTCDFSKIVRRGVSVPDDEIVVLVMNGKTSHTLKRAAGVNQMVDLRIYSDMLATLGEEPNGIAQIEGSTRVFINNRNWFRSFTPFRYGFFSVQASKLDSRFQTLNIDSTFSRIDIIQRSFVSADIGANVFGFWLQRKSRSWASVNSGAGIHLTRTANENDTTSLTSQYFFMEALFEFKELRNFGIDFGSRMYWQTVPGLETESGNTQALLRLGATAYWNPIGNPESRIFARVNYYQNLDKGEQPFVQFQVGYSALISSLFSKK